MPLPWDKDTEDPETENETTINTEHADLLTQQQTDVWEAIDKKRQLKKSESKTDFDGISTD